jgi:hypothetical protein
MSDLLFFAGGECVSRHGTIVWRESAAQDNASTFTRAAGSADGTYVGGSGRIVKADANIPRVSWNDGTPSLLVEQSFINLVSSDNFDSGWSNTGGDGPAVTTGQSDPAGGTGAYTITDNNTGAVEGKVLTVSFTGNATKGIVFVVKPKTDPASGSQQIGLYSTTATAWRMLLSITWSNGVPSVTATHGAYLGQRYIGNGFYAIYGTATGVVASDTNQIFLYAASDAAQTGAFDVYRVNAYNAVVPPYSILDASVTSQTETFYADFVAPPQAMTVYAKFQDAGSLAQGATRGIVHVGGTSGTSGARFQITVPSTSAYRVGYSDGTTGVSSDITSSAAVWSSAVELRGVLTAAGSLVAGQSLNGGAETLGDAVTAPGSVSLPSEWSGARIYIGSRGTVSQGVGVYQAIKVARGEKTMAQMRAL